jgi:CO/xanthine dehydrogenase Mo-binding subunit
VPPAAIANAIASATGIRMRDLPMTPERVFDALQQLTSSRD